MRPKMLPPMPYSPWFNSCCRVVLEISACSHQIKMAQRLDYQELLYNLNIGRHIYVYISLSPSLSLSVSVSISIYLFIYLFNWHWVHPVSIEKILSN